MMSTARVLHRLKATGGRKRDRSAGLAEEYTTSSGNLPDAAEWSVRVRHRRTHRYRATAIDIERAASRVLALVGPVADISEDPIRAVLADWAGSSTIGHIALEPRPDSRRWDYRPPGRLRLDHRVQRRRSRFDARIFTASFCSKMIGPAVIDSAFQRMCSDPIAFCNPYTNGTMTEIPSTTPLLAESVDFPQDRALTALAQTSLRIQYRSTSGIDGSATAVSGVVFVPRGPTPPAGWPIASIGHAPTGVDRGCAPSVYPDLRGSLSTVIQFLEQGFVVVMSDYQGLGTHGLHPYLEPKTAGCNVIDAVRASRQAIDDASNAWIGYGFSQGGQAAWAANELSPAYGQGLRLLGTVSISPPADLQPVVDSMVNGTLTCLRPIHVQRLDGSAYLQTD